MSEFADLGGYHKVFPAIFPLEQGYPGCAAFLEPLTWDTSNGVFELGAAWLSACDMSCLEKGRIAHEYGHTFGLLHSYEIPCARVPPIPRSTVDPTDKNDSCVMHLCTNDDCTETRLGDSTIASNADFDMLGGDHLDRYEDFFPVHFHATWQAFAGWLTETQVLTPDVSGAYWLTTLESLSPTPKAIRVPLGPDQEGDPQYYWLQTREFSPWSSDFYPAVFDRCQVDVRLQATNMFGASGGVLYGPHTYFFNGNSEELMGGQRRRITGESIMRPGMPFWDPYRGIRMSIRNCVARETGLAVKVRVEFSHLEVDPRIVAVFDRYDTTQTITLTNNGSVPIEIGSASIGGRHPNAFMIDLDGCSGGALEPDGFCDITVSHVPTDNQDGHPNNHGVLKVPNSDRLRPEAGMSLLGE